LLPRGPRPAGSMRINIALVLFTCKIRVFLNSSVARIPEGIRALSQYVNEPFFQVMGGGRRVMSGNP
jgi:hypothetical protein